MKGMKWLEEKGKNSGIMYNYMDTKINLIKPNIPKWLIFWWAW